METESVVCDKCGNKVPWLGFCDQCAAPLPKRDGGAEKDAGPGARRPAAAPPDPNRTILTDPEEKAKSKYEIVRKISEGGMGIVHEAIDRSINKKVAIKEMKAEIGINSKLRERFLNEAKTVAKLHHPNIVYIETILTGEELGRDPKGIYIVFEYLTGQSLEDALARGAMPLQRVKPILQKVCSALRYAHENRVIHRDLKPANIMLCAEDVVKVVDFGIARTAVDTIRTVSQQWAGGTSGTLPYMAPEQELGQQDHLRMDIYAAGVTFYEALTGEKPFPGPNYLAQKERMMFRKASERVPGLPAKADALIEKCLQADPAKRYQSAEELLTAFEQL